MADREIYPEVTDTPKKRQVKGSRKENAKKQRLLDHNTGNPCGCKRLKCWEVTTAEQRQALIDRFTGYQTKDEQDAFLASLIRVHPVAQRRPRQDENAANLMQNSYKYHILIMNEGKPEDVQVCHQVMLSFFGIKKGRLESIQKSLKESGELYL